MKNLVNAALDPISNPDFFFEKLPVKTIHQKVSGDIIRIEQHHQPPGSVPEHITDKHVILIGHKPLEIEIELGGELRHQNFIADQCIINPAYCPTSCCWTESADFTIFFIEPSIVDRACYESTNLYMQDIIPSFPQFDRLIYGITSQFRSYVEVAELPSQIYIDSLGSLLVNHLVEIYSRSKPIIQKTPTTFSSVELQKLHTYIIDRLDHNILSKELADLFNICTPYFGKLLKETTGLSPYQYLIQTRIFAAVQLIKTTKKDFSEIAHLTGLGTVNNLSRLFKQKLGRSPNLFR